MKTHFITLFKYDRYASQLIIDTINKTENNSTAIRLVAHLLAAQQVWLGRCKNQAAAFELWPDWKAEQLEPIMNENHQLWINFLEYLSPDDFENTISYKNSRGDAFENKLSDILAHVINHGTHHRAQAGQYLKSGGLQLPNTDYIGYLRQ